MSSFINNVKSELNSEKVLTENGAVAYKTSGKALLDMNFNVSTFRNGTDKDIEDAFSKAYFEEPELAVKWMFFARDCRGGMGERRLFRVCLKWLAENKTDIAVKLIPLVQEYGRFDDVFCAFDSNDKYHDAVVDYISNKLADDYKLACGGSPCSLLAKWLPSINTSSNETRKLANKLVHDLGMKSAEYRKMLSKIRKHLDVLEVKASANQWGEVDYNKVPSMANLKYKAAFLKHDKARRSEYLEKLVSGDSSVKINSSTAFPCDIVAKYGVTWSGVGDFDATLEGMWKALPDYVKDAENHDTIVVRDGSGSMCSQVGNTETTALDVASSLAIYFSEKMKNPEFRNKFITFSRCPELVDMSKCESLHDKLELLSHYDDCSNTNFEATMNLLLNAARNNNMKQEDVPNILVVSDMNFDYCVADSKYEKALMENIAKKWNDAGYKVPRITFWNVIGGCGRTAPIPVQTSETGVALVSGFSPAIASMVYSSKLDPFEVLVEKLNSERYAMVAEALKAA